MYRIAIVDDDYMVRESTKAVIERNFKEENFQVECFSTFSQLQSELSQELFTVYILDIELPDGNGLELAKEIRKIQERAYIVFLTAYEKYALSGYEVRAFHYIIKENMEKKLVQTMRQICREIGIHVKGQYLVKRAGVFEKVALREICYIYKEQKNSIFQSFPTACDFPECQQLPSAVPRNLICKPSVDVRSALPCCTRSLSDCSKR